MAKTKKEVSLVEDEEEEYYAQYNQWITINNHSTGTINVTIKQFGKPKPPPPPPDE